MRNSKLKRVAAAGAAAVLAGVGIAVASPMSASEAQAAGCRTETSDPTRMICLNNYPGGAQGNVQVVQVVNGFSFGVLMTSSAAPGQYVCVPRGGSMTVDRSISWAGTYYISAGTYIPMSPVPC